MNVIKFFLCVLLFSAKSSYAEVSKSEVIQLEQNFEKFIAENPLNQNAEFKFLNLWESSSQNAFARWIPEINTRFIELHGGLLKDKNLDLLTLSFLICHETGHFFGGGPFLYEGSDLSAEGQSDYYAAGYCFKTFYIKNKSLFKVSAGKKYLEFCSALNNKKDKDLCAISLKAGESYVKALIKYDGNEYLNMGFNLSSGLRPLETISGFEYPTYQCRLDTIKAAALCSLKSIKNKNCKAAKETSRPACWFVD